MKKNPPVALKMIEFSRHDGFFRKGSEGCRS